MHKIVISSACVQHCSGTFFISNQAVLRDSERMMKETTEEMHGLRSATGDR